MSQVQDGQLIEGVLYLLDTGPIINPTFNCPAISMTNLATSLGIPSELIRPNQVTHAIAPLAETLFPTPRIPVFRTEGAEGWIVFEERSVVAYKTEQVKVDRRKTLISYQSPKPPLSDRSTGLHITTPDEPGLRPKPLREIPSGDIGFPSTTRDDQPVSAEIGEKANKSFFKPLFIGRGKKLGREGPGEEHPSPSDSSKLEQARLLGHDDQTRSEIQELSSTPGSGFEMIEIPQKPSPSPIKNDYLHVDLEVPDSPYEKTIQPSDPGPDLEVSRPRESASSDPEVHDTKVITERLYEPRVDLGVHKAALGDIVIGPISPVAVQSLDMGDEPSTAIKPISPVFGMESPISPTPPSPSAEVVTPTSIPSAIPSSPIAQILTPISAVFPSTPVVEELPLTPGIHTTLITRISIPSTPTIPSEISAVSPTSPAPLVSPIDLSTASTPKPGKSTSRSSSSTKKRSSGGHRPRSPSNHGIKSERTRSREHDKKAGKPSRSSRSRQSQEVDTWLESVFKDLPFGPDKNMSRALESIKKDWKIFTAEIVCLVGLAYVIQVSGW